MNTPPTRLLISLLRSSLSLEKSLPLSSAERPGGSTKALAQAFLCRSLSEKMNRCVYQQNAFAACGGEMMGPSISVSDSVVCPKPRRLGLLNPSMNDQIRPSRWQINHQAEICDSKAGTELLEIILTKGNYGAEKSNIHVASSPPFFCGSPPSRASNPVIQDAQFGIEKHSPLAPAPIQASSSSCVRMKFGQKPAAVRIEGFDCLSHDRRNCSISAVA
ncbi:hypothetical protein F0562_023795 [Nyssa sinensis]|uniref:Uncharacterized protein n=1 Tax=Nyssa sinensis TaxID=561372 RepID=A0A5J5BJ71_9ASTE|nr:hypothetical protein F0562_023795 [Nyssa sinensis]